ncbi:Glutathione S-transferase omega-1 [Bulinus truncatus]|nr:Glutathione S-transferase omega-1 [Bulinus truncatus]
MTQKSYVTGSAFPPLKPGTLRIYSMRFCPYAERARLVLTHKNIPFETVNINLLKKPEWYLEKNPNGAVPAVEKDDKIIYESTAVCEWLDDVYQQNRLQPSDPYIKAWDRILLEYFGKVTTAFYGILRNPDERENLVKELQKHFKFYDDILSKRGGPHFGGKSPSMIDFFLWSHFERFPALATFNAKIAVDKNEFPKLAAWCDAMVQVPAVKTIMWDPKVHLQFLSAYGSGNPDFDMGLNE